MPAVVRGPQVLDAAGGVPRLLGPPPDAGGGRGEADPGATGDGVADEVPARAEPQPYGGIGDQVREAFGGDQAAVHVLAGVAGFVLDEEVAGGRVDPVGADDEVGAPGGAVLEPEHRLVAVLLDAHAPQAEAQGAGGELGEQDLVQVRAVDGVVRGTVPLLALLAERGAGEESAVVPAAQFDRAGPYGDRAQAALDAEAVQQPGGVGGDLEAGADLAQVAGLFVHVAGQARAGEPECEGQTSDPRPHDSDAWLLFHSHLTRGLRAPAGPPRCARGSAGAAGAPGPGPRTWRVRRRGAVAGVRCRRAAGGRRAVRRPAG